MFLVAGKVVQGIGVIPVIIKLEGGTVKVMLHSFCKSRIILCSLGHGFPSQSAHRFVFKEGFTIVPTVPDESVTLALQGTHGIGAT